MPSSQPAPAWSELLIAAAARGRPGRRGADPLSTSPTAAGRARHWLVTHRHLAVVASVAFLCGVLGQLVLEGFTLASLVDGAYISIANFFLHGPHEVKEHPLLGAILANASRFVSPVATAIAAFLGVRALTKRSSRNLCRGGHTIVCGVEGHGARLARESLGAGECVVAIARDESSPAADELRRAGAVIVLGDPTSADALRRAFAGSAARVIATMDSDRDNLSVALALREVLDAERPPPRPVSEERVRCYVHCEDESLSALARQRRTLGRPEDAFEVHLFSRREAAARIFATDHLPRLAATAAREGRPVRLTVIGSGPIAEALLVRILESPHRSEPLALDARVLGPGADARIRSLRRRYAVEKASNGVGDLARLAGIDSGGSAEELLETLSNTNGASEVDAVLVAVDRDEVALALAWARGSLAPRAVPVFAHVTDPRFAALVRGPETGVTVFGSDDVTGSREAVVGAALDALADRIHDAYRNDRLVAGAPIIQEVQRPYFALEEHLRRSNVSAADHMPMKLALVGRAACALDGRTSPPLSPSELERLAKIEHTRWVAERILDGWTYAEGEKSVEARTSPYLVPWESLSEAVREYDRAAVRDMVGHLEKVGLGALPAALDTPIA